MKILHPFCKKFTRLIPSAAMLLAMMVAVFPFQSVLAAGTVLAPGDIAFTGYITNGNPDSFSFITLVPLSAGTEIYFTDTGWTGSNFFEVTEIKADGERLTRLTVNNPITPGTLIRSNDTSLDFTWAITGSIGAGGIYQELAFGANGDQITAVQSTNSTNPLFSGFTGLTQIDYTGAFEPAVSNGTGAILPGLSQAAGTAVLFNLGGSYAAFNLNTLVSGTAAEWRTAIANSANWTFNTTGTSLPTGSVTVLTPASILTQPTNQIININTTAMLSVAASGSAPLSYQWYQGNTGDVSNPIIGGTTASFTTPVLTDTTSYWVRVSNSLATIDSATATITVIDPATLTQGLYLPVVLK
jgi:hypothetical protein